jgi:hypothetical protein
LIRTLGTIGYARDTDSYLKRSSDFLFWIPLSLLFFFQHFLYNGSSVPERSLMLYLMPSVGFFLVLFLTMNPLLSKEKPCQDKCPLLLESSCNKFNNIAQTASTCLAITQAFHMRFVSDREQQATPPAVFLADGGHYENSGLLYLMEQVLLTSVCCTSHYHYFSNAASLRRIDGLQIHHFREWCEMFRVELWFKIWF